MKQRKFFGLLGLALAVAACSGEDGETPAEQASIQFTVALQDGLNGLPLEGMEVCAAGHDEVPCAYADADGRVTLQLPARSELMLRCSSDDHGPAYMTWAIGDQDIDAGHFSVLPAWAQSALISLSGGNPKAKGAITVNVYTDLVERDQRVAGFTTTIEPQTGKTAAYVGDDMLPDPSLTASSLGGPAVFVDVEAGEAQITLSHPSRECHAGFGWPTGDPLTLRTRIFELGLSNVTFYCPEP